MLNKHSRSYLSIAIFGLVLFLLNGCSGSGGDSNRAAPSSTSGKGGSLARFNISGQTLYTINGAEVKSYSLINPKAPGFVHAMYVNFDIETLFVNNNRLFIGSRSGVHIYDISDPQAPSFISMFAHLVSCDPVIVQGDYAYVTLQGVRNDCVGGGSNQLDILDISNIEAPYLVKSYAMIAPTGLGIDGNQLFICDGWAGLKQLNVTDPRNVKVTGVEEIICNDIIVWEKRLVVVGDQFVDQFDYSVTPMQLLSEIKTDQL